jgi:hypothetical protein
MYCRRDADIVVLLDVSVGMKPCLDAVRQRVGAFMDWLSSEVPGRWRLKVCGYRDQVKDGTNWWVENPFVRHVAAAQAQLAAPNMEATGGGSGSESLLDALYTLAKMEQGGPDEAEGPDRWRSRAKADRMVVFVTDAAFKTSMTLPEVAGGTVSDVHDALSASRIRLFGIAPEWAGYAELACYDAAQVEFYATLAAAPALAGLGKEGDCSEAKAVSAAALAAAVGLLDPVLAFVLARGNSLS